MSTSLDEVYEELVHTAKTDPDVLGFILCGSRGKGFATAQSDYDCAMVVTDDVYEDKVDRMSMLPASLDIGVHTLQSFAEHADWNGPRQWDRYNWAHLRAQIDKTGGLIQRLIDEKAKVPEQEVDSFVRRSLDHYINQVYRSIKCLRDGNSIGHRLEAADSIRSLLDVVFAVHDRRLRPYYKYLSWELTEFPLARLPWAADEFLEMLLAILTTGSCVTQQEIFKWVGQTLRSEGYGAVLDAWGDDLWIAEYSPS